MSRYKKKVDLNQKQVTKELRALGFSVALTHIVGHGFPDFVVGMGGVNYLVELKSAYGQTLTTDEKVFFQNWSGQVHMHHSTTDIVRGFLEHILLLGNLFYLQIELNDILRGLINE